MGRLSERVAIITGAGRGLGRAHALYLAGQGAAVVVNDRGSSVSGDGSDPSAADLVVAEIERAGGRAMSSHHDVADWIQAEQLIALAVEAFGHLDVLVNNAGIVRDRTLVNLSEEDWDAVVRVHLKGHAAPTKHAMSHWRDRAKAGEQVRASVVHTSSIAGFAGNFGQANYSAVKAAVLGLSAVVDLEGARYGVRSNVVSPGGRTRIAMTVPGAEEELRAPDAEGSFDLYAPENVSPLIAWLAERDCPAHGQVLHITGNRVLVLEMPPIVHALETTGRWTLDDLDRELTPRLREPRRIEEFLLPASTIEAAQGV